jgi:hypothetical protein
MPVVSMPGLMPQTNKHSIQVQIRMKGAAIKRLRPTRATMRQIIEVWIDTGQLPPEVRIKATVWGEPLTAAAVRKRLSDMRLHYGCPGLVKAYARPDTTYCDYDTGKAPALSVVFNLAQWLGLRPLFIRDDKTARGWHRIVRWNRKFPPGVIVALQMAMGSDSKRELFNLLRVISGEADHNKRWNLLFERKL